jgi:hypothetical protein
MKFLAAAALAVIVFAAPVLADPIDPDEDGIGVYFDPCACVNCVPMAPGIQYGYIVITHPTSPQGVGGWEASLSWDGPAVLSNWELAGSAINFLTEPNFYVGLGAPIINPFTYPAIICARFQLELLDNTQPVNFYIDGVYAPSLESGQPAYLDGADYEIIKPLQQPTGGPDIPVATINGDCAVATQDVTWSAVKSLYR